jgi:hypothetical protein
MTRPLPSITNPVRGCKVAVEADDVALAAMACITHLKHTTGSITTDAGRYL